MKKILIIAIVLFVSIIMVQPLMAEDALGRANTMTGEAVQDIARGFYWGRCTQTYSAVGNAWTWCLDSRNNIWWGTSDDRCGNMMMHSCSENHWIGFNVVDTNGTWNYCRYENY
jgi:hypothetical protein